MFVHPTDGRTGVHCPSNPPLVVCVWRNCVSTVCKVKAWLIQYDNVGSH